jgi:Ca2+-binding EF-hand superfamily protein
MLEFIHLFRADMDHDQQLSKDELLNYVLKNVNQHLREAKDRNTQLFLLIDSNQDGEIYNMSVLRKSGDKKDVWMKEKPSKPVPT